MGLDGNKWSDSFFNLSLFMNGTLHFFILFIILNILFWVVITKVSKEAIYNEVTHNLEEPMIILLNKLTPGQKSLVANLPYDELKIMYKETNSTVVNNNKLLKLLSIAIIIILFLFVITYALFYTKHRGEQPSFFHLLSENLYIFLFVGLIEIIFFLTIAVNFIPSLPSHILKSSKDILVDIIDEQIKKSKDGETTIDIQKIIKAKESLSTILISSSMTNEQKLALMKESVAEKFRNI